MQILKKGDLIGLVAPASYMDEEKLKSAIKNIESLGYKVRVGESVKNRWHSFAGEDFARAKDLNTFFRDKDIKAIMCVRGGYGSIRLLNLLDYDMIKKNPKIFIGYSDITSIHMALYKKCNMMTYHGPMAVSNLSGEYNKDTLKHFLEVVTEDKIIRKLENFGKELKFFNDKSCEGIVVGGNLATLISNIGTEYDLDYTDKILFLEDIGENTYKIDRMLWHLKNLGIFDRVAGILLGDFSDCEKSGENDMELEEVFSSHFNGYDKPVCYNFQSGHCTPMQTLILGCNLKIDGKGKILEQKL
ncbi:S66 peptidase family protein [Cetobacterium sp.]|uniref:S66 peptidase family protein n=1 Tax=Cetobacterium sp. TaxID=2071632 RepID=UPI002FCC950C